MSEAEVRQAWFAKANALVADPHAREEHLLKAAEWFVVWGDLDRADQVLNRLLGCERLRGPVARLVAASRQLRRSGIMGELDALSPGEVFRNASEVYLARKPEGSDRIVLVFTGGAQRLWLSLQVLHQYMKKLDSHVIYLCDLSNRMFLNGLRTLGTNYAETVQGLRKQADKLGVRHVHVLASSAGGYIGLRAALDLRASSFAGMSIRSTLSLNSKIPLLHYEERAVKECRSPELLGDLREVLAPSAYPERIQLYCGDKSRIDRANAENLAGLPRVKIWYLRDYQAHDVVSGLVARGQFENALRRLVDPGYDA